MSETFDSVSESAKTPKTEVKRWLLELKQAEKREKEWRKTGQEIYKRYRGDTKKKNTFNILWANTEVLRPSLYNSIPKPDVRRRFRDSDPLGKAVSELLERCLIYSVENGFDETIKLDVLDDLLPGRGISRVRYIPSIKQSGTKDAPEEALDFEQVKPEHVDWMDFRHGPAKIWAKVPWVGYRHQFIKDEVKERFGEETADLLKYETPDDDDIKKRDNDDIQQLFSMIEMWEIWDRDSKTCFFIAESYKDKPLYPKAYPDGTPPIKFKDFFDCPEPLRMVEDATSLIPTPMFELYKEQADELDQISARINKIVAALKVRGVYDSTLTELGDLFKGGDNDMIPAAQAAAYMNNGGLEKAIWWMPIQQAAVVLKELYVARDAAKQTIYELSGISDIMRSATNPSETLGAQQIKANFGSQRLQRGQKDVQRYCRDLIRLMAEVIGEQFQQSTLQQMSGLNFPTQAMKMQAQQQMQQAQQPPMPGQPPAPSPSPDPQVLQMLQMPTWEDIYQVLKSDLSREFRVDVETDSTVSATLQEDMQGLQEVLTGLVQFWDGVGPAVQSGALPIDAVKAISLTICRRARMGMEVEDALDKIQQPQGAQADPKMQQQQEAMQKQQADLQKQQEALGQQKDQLRAQSDDLMKREMQLKDSTIEAKGREVDSAIASHTEAMAQQKDQMQMVHDRDMAEAQRNFDQWKAELENQTKIVIAEISAKTTMATTTANNEATNAAPQEQSNALTELVQTVNKNLEGLIGAHTESTQQMTKALTAPRRLVKNPDGSKTSEIIQ